MFFAFYLGSTLRILAILFGLSVPIFAQWNLDTQSQLVWTTGSGEGANNIRISLNFNVFQKRISPKWDLKGAIGPNFSLYKGHGRNSTSHEEVRDYSLTPFLTFFRINSSLSVTPIVEVGIGFHYLNQKGAGAKEFSTRFQFGDHIGFGAAWGPCQKYRITYSFQHLSNGGISAPNPGINFHLMTYGMKFKP